jgi:hypothetical protein
MGGLIMKTFYVAAALAFAAGSAAAQTTSGPSLLDDSRESQLERWLGAGDQRFTPLFTGVPGDSSLDFHSAVDGKGATFTLLQVSNPAGASWLIGAYNPQSWSSTDGFHLTPADADRTAFLFNMTVPAVYRQVPSTYILPSQGERQTDNASNQGPTFGAGPDLLVNDRLDTALSWQVSYGNPLDEGKSIIDRSLGAQLFHIDALQLYAVSPVPEPRTAGMFAAGLGLFSMLARRRRARV